MSQLQPTGRQPKEQVCGSRRHSGLTTPLRVFSAARAAVRTVGRAAMVQANEAAMLMPAAAMTPLRLASGGFDGASSSSPPVKAATASTTRPVLLVHGFAGTKSSWSSVAHTLGARGLTVEAMSYPPLGTSVEQLAERLVAEVERILCRTGADKVHLVGHSLRGVVIAQAIADHRLSGRVDTVITLGSPLLRRVAAAPMPAGVRWLSGTASLDMIVPGLRSLPSHAQVETIMFDGVGHLGLLLSRQVIGCIAAALCAQKPATAAEAAMRVLPSAS